MKYVTVKTDIISAKIVFTQLAKNVTNDIKKLAKSLNWKIDNEKLMDSYRRGYFIVYKYTVNRKPVSVQDLKEDLSDGVPERRIKQIFDKYKASYPDYNDLYDKMLKQYEAEIKIFKKEGEKFLQISDKYDLGNNTKLNIYTKSGEDGSVSFSLDMNSNKLVNFI